MGVKDGGAQVASRETPVPGPPGNRAGLPVPWPQVPSQVRIPWAEPLPARPTPAHQDLLPRVPGDPRPGRGPGFRGSPHPPLSQVQTSSFSTAPFMWFPANLETPPPHSLCTGGLFLQSPSETPGASQSPHFPACTQPVCTGPTPRARGRGWAGVQTWAQRPSRSNTTSTHTRAWPHARRHPPRMLMAPRPRSGHELFVPTVQWPQSPALTPGPSLGSRVDCGQNLRAPPQTPRKLRLPGPFGGRQQGRGQPPPRSSVAPSLLLSPRSQDHSCRLRTRTTIGVNGA